MNRLANKATVGIEKLLEIMATLRNEQRGCAWDRAQTFETIVPHTLEEAYEVADVIERGSFDELPDELGDLLFQVVFYARIAEENSLFDFSDIVDALAEKLTRRHPHVFADAPASDAAGLQGRWEAQKRAERARRADGQKFGALSGIARALPALSRAAKIQRRAAGVGFDWCEVDLVSAKVREELKEVEAEISAGGDRHRLEAEIGDLLFACTNMARHLGVDPEAGLRRATNRFEKRFGYIEAELAREGKEAYEVDLAELDRLWDLAKRCE